MNGNFGFFQTVVSTDSMIFTLRHALFRIYDFQNLVRLQDECEDWPFIFRVEIFQQGREYTRVCECLK